MIYKNVWVLLATSFLIAMSAYSGETEGTYRKLGERTFAHINGNVTKKLKLQIDIADWRVDCSKSRAVIWGRARGPTPLGVAPYAKVYVVDLKKMKILFAYTTSRGPYDAEFSKKSGKMLIDEILIDFDSGKVIEEVSHDDLRFERESCEEFQGKRLLQ